MKVYLSGGTKAPSHMMHVAPAADVKGEVPAEWVNANNEPLNITIDFHFGVAEVPDDLGKYLLSRGLALKSRLIVGTAA